jgi:Zn-finger nucleic acid-binding protein
VPTCPKCGAELHLGPFEHIDVWSCPAGHGLGFTISEAYGRIVGDEVQRIWKAAGTAAAGQVACPLCLRTMVNVTVPVGADSGPTVSLDVCREDQLIWFDPGELDELPEGATASEPSPDEQAKIDRVRRAFDHDLDEAEAEEEEQGVLNRFASHVVAQHPGFAGLLDHVVYGHRIDDAPVSTDANAA